MKLGADSPALEIESTSTGSLGLDIALGIGGLPKGRIVEVYGPESSGKTTLALHVVAEEQKKGGSAPLSMPSTRSTRFMRASWGSTWKLRLISHTGEQALEIVDTLVRSGAVSLIVVDLGGGADAQGRDRGRHGRCRCIFRRCVVPYRGFERLAGAGPDVACPGPDGPAAILERRRGQAGHRQLRERHHHPGAARNSYCPPSASPPLTRPKPVAVCIKLESI